MKKTLNETEQTVMDLLANVLFGAKRQISADTDWRAVYEECRKQSVTMLGLQGAKAAGPLPEDVREEWEKEAIAAAFGNGRVSMEHTWFHDLMKKAGIPYVILKGCASAAYYPKPGNRVMGDVDFLVSRTDVERTGNLLKEQGFEPSGEDHHCHIVYSRGPTHLELHFEPNGLPDGEAGDKAREYLKDILEQGREMPYENGQVVCPSVFHHGLIILIHTGHHLVSSGLGLRHLCDWAVFVSSMSGEEFRELFEARFKEMGLWKFVCIVTRTAERWLGVPHRAWAGEADEALADAVLADIFSSGNFGRKEEGRTYQSLLIAGRSKKDIGETSMARQFIRSVNEIVRSKWPSAQKNPFALLAGWIFFCGRYMIRVLKKQRPMIRPKKIVTGAEERRNIYKAFELFETVDKRIG